ncbi:hypothetical protein SAMN06265795_102279 [Noviherbaspirillum humi]|uniref:Uncharacterized protein n=1 Tax=Noviherbaspirillum humi TaxID=1688639 RepID=A0A239DNU1_9BURK|nr:hypothetical protein [Noviherbaspirillum humi]SNS33849.1 hypothetical protein SAMN06265795_102279 [Noviherbaspirillum humi]
MSTTQFTAGQQFGQPVSYGENLGRAFRAFIAALVAGRPVDASLKAQAVAETSARKRVSGLRQLYALASQYDSVSPNLAAELRFIAGRD